MKLDDYRRKLALLHKKSKMDEFIDWPFVYDEDEEGDVWISEDGTFHISGADKRWMTTTLNVINVDDMRFTVAFEDPVIDSGFGETPSESTIRIYFKGQTRIDIENTHDTYRATLGFWLDEITEETELRAFQEFDLIEKGVRVHIGNKPLCPRNEEPWHSLAGNLAYGNIDIARTLEESDQANSGSEGGHVSSAMNDDPLALAICAIAADISILDDQIRDKEAGREDEDADNPQDMSLSQLVEHAKECAQLSHLNVAEAIYEGWRLYESFSNESGGVRSDFTEVLVARLAESWLEKHGMLNRYMDNALENDEHSRRTTETLLEYLEVDEGFDSVYDELGLLRIDLPDVDIDRDAIQADLLIELTFIDGSSKMMTVSQFADILWDAGFSAYANDFVHPRDREFEEMRRLIKPGIVDDDDLDESE